MKLEVQHLKPTEILIKITDNEGKQHEFQERVRRNVVTQNLVPTIIDLIEAIEPQNKDRYLNLLLRFLQRKEDYYKLFKELCELASSKQFRAEIDAYTQKLIDADQFVIIPTKLLEKYKKTKRLDKFFELSPESTKNLIKAGYRLKLWAILYMIMPSLIKEKDFRALLRSAAGDVLIDNNLLDECMELLSVALRAKTISTTLADLTKFLTFTTGTDLNVMFMNILNKLIFYLLPTVTPGHNLASFLVKSAQIMSKTFLQSTYQTLFLYTDIDASRLARGEEHMLLVSLRQVLADRLKNLLPSNEYIQNCHRCRLDSPIIKYITEPLVVKYFFVDRIGDVPLEKPQLLNFIVRDIIREHKQLGILSKLLLCYSKPKHQLFDGEIKPNKLQPPIADVVNRFVGTLSDMYAPTLLKRMLTRVINDFASYRYFHIVSDVELNVKWQDILPALCQYYTMLYTGVFDSRVNTLLSRPVEPIALDVTEVIEQAAEEVQPDVSNQNN